MKVNPILLVDFYKVHHQNMYPKNMIKLYSNWTPRASRIDDIQEVVVFGTTYFIKEYLIELFNQEFFFKHRVRTPDGKLHSTTQARKDALFENYRRHVGVDTKHLEDLWELGYLPIEIKALDEGTLCPIGVPMLTITNTHPDFAWLVNYLETLISCMIWKPTTSATIAYNYKKSLLKYALETDEKNVDFVNWQAHDFSIRGMSCVESAITSGMGHLLSFNGTDNIPAIYQLENSYNASGLIGASVPATEHSVMCMGTKQSEIETFSRLLDLYPNGILSVVSDTWDLWKVCTEYLPTLRKQILGRDGKLVIRPDSGNPVEILCGLYPYDYEDGTNNAIYKTSEGYVILEENPELSIRQQAELKGLIEILWDTFGGIVNGQGYKVLDSHIGAIYGDSITMERAKEICQVLKKKGFASTNVVLGIGSYTYQYNTRDTFGFAMKATYGEVMIGQSIDHREIWKDPVTDDGVKKSKKGLLRVRKFENTLVVEDRVDLVSERHGELKTVFLNGKIIRESSLEEIRGRLNETLYVSP